MRAAEQLGKIEVAGQQALVTAYRAVQLYNPVDPLIIQRNDVEFEPVLQKAVGHLPKEPLVLEGEDAKVLSEALIEVVVDPTVRDRQLRLASAKILAENLHTELNEVIEKAQQEAAREEQLLRQFNPDYGKRIGHTSLRMRPALREVGDPQETHIGLSGHGHLDAARLAIREFLGKDHPLIIKSSEQHDRYLPTVRDALDSAIMAPPHRPETWIFYGVDVCYIETALDRAATRDRTYQDANAHDILAINQRIQMYPIEKLAQAA
jgi:hypothetical protein